MAKDTVEVLIEGGTATPGPPLGPALGPFGINMMQVVDEINKKTADFAGMKVPVKVSIDRDTKDFEIEIGEFFMEDTNSSIYALKTSVGQERNVARLLARKAKMPGVGILSILVPESLKGYILVESETKIDLRNPNLKVQHLRGVVEGKGGITFEEAKRFLKPEPIISSIQKGSIVELISGPFKGERAKVVRIDESREEVVLELIEAAGPIPVTVKADQIRIIQKEAD